MYDEYSLKNTQKKSRHIKTAYKELWKLTKMNRYKYTNFGDYSKKIITKNLQFGDSGDDLYSSPE